MSAGAHPEQYSGRKLGRVMTTHAGLVGYYDYSLVALSIFIAILAAYAALDLAGRITAARGSMRTAWLWGGASALGSGIWAMQYLGMRALHLPVPVLYDLPTVLLSMLAAILASGVALSIVSRPTMGLFDRVAGGIVMGSGMAAMQYIGMAAMRLPAVRVYDAGLIIFSITLAIAFSYVALRLSFALKGEQTPLGWRKIGGTLVMGVAIPVTHYMGMAAVTFVPAAAVQGSIRHAVGIPGFISASIVVVTFILFGIIVVSAAQDRQSYSQSQLVTENLAQLQAVFDSMTEAFVVVDSENRVVQRNQAAATLFGWSRKTASLQEIVNTFDGFGPTGKLLTSDEWPIMRATRGDYCTNEEVVIRRRDTGKSVTTEITTVRVAVSGETTRKFIVSLRDITERQQLDEARVRLAAIVECSEDAIIGENYEGIITTWNRGAAKIYGYTSAEMVNQPILRLLPPDRAGEEDAILATVRQGKVIEHFQTVHVRRDGQHINVWLTISPIRDANGNVIGASKIARDITERMKLESQLQQSQKMDAVGQLTGGIAHDFNNLLGIVIGNLDLLESQVSEDTAALKRVQTAQKAALRGADLTRRLLAFSCNENLSPTPTNLHDVILSMIEMTNRVIGPEIKIATSFDESVSLILIDTSSLESALVNLMVNARDAMPKGGTITISTKLCDLEDTYPSVQTGELKPGRHACVSVSDTGHGMSRETLERVFEPFFTTKPRGKGTGLGLAMVYGFVKQSHGSVRIYSELGYGTTVTLYLPLMEDATLPVTEVVKSRSLFNGSASVLVVDDELDLLDIATAYLAEMGCKSYTAVDGKDALQVIKREKDIDLMVTDIIMPGGMNGVELAHNVRQVNPKIKIIYCSGFPADALAEHGMPLVDGPLLRKPYQRGEFSALVRRVMTTENAIQNKDR